MAAGRGMTAIVTSPIGGGLVLALLVAVLVRRGLCEASGARAPGPGWMILPLLVIFVAQLAARFLLL